MIAIKLQLASMGNIFSHGTHQRLIFCSFLTTFLDKILRLIVLVAARLCYAQKYIIIRIIYQRYIRVSKFFLAREERERVSREAYLIMLDFLLHEVLLASVRNY